MAATDALLRKLEAFGPLPDGDFCDLHVFMLDKMDHDIITLADSAVVNIPRQKVLEMTERPSIARALLLVTLVDEAILREWITNLGQRTAPERLAHLFCELYFRMRSVGLADEAAYEFPITQAELADTVGLSHVHTNKSLRKLIKANLLTFAKGRVTISDMDELVRLSGFRPNYLHLRGGKGAPGARPARGL